LQTARERAGVEDFGKWCTLNIDEIGPEGFEILSLLFAYFSEKGVEPGFFPVSVFKRYSCLLGLAFYSEVTGN
jgi:hypothetical protein